MSLRALYHSDFYSVTESAGYLLVGFKEGAVSFIVKEIWNAAPLTRGEAEGLYAELAEVGKTYRCRKVRLRGWRGLGLSGEERVCVMLELERCLKAENCDISL